MSKESFFNSQLGRRFSTKRKVYFLLLLLLNFVAALLFAIGYVHHTNKIQLEQEERNIDNLVNTVDTLSDTFGNFVMSQNMIASSYGKYIEDSGISLEDAIDYLFVWKDFYKAIAIVDVDSLQGFVMSPETTDSAEKINYSKNKWMRDICSNYENSRQLFIRVSDVVLNQDTDSYDIAFYVPVEIESKQYIIAFRFDTENIKLAGMNVKGLNQEHGLLIDKSGKIIIGELPEFKKAIGMNFFEYHDSKEKDVTSDKIREGIIENGIFTYNIYEYESGIPHVCIASSIPNTDGWIYVYCSSQSEYARSEDIMNLARVFLGSLLIWLLLVVAFFTIYNFVIKKSFEIIEKQNIDLEYASQAKTTFVSNMSHELRTPINAVLGMNEMILKESEEDNIREYAYDIKSAGNTLLSVINDVLDFSKIESGKMEIVDSEYSLADTVKDVYTLISLKAEAKELDFIINMSENIPKTMIGDDVE